MTTWKKTSARLLPGRLARDDARSDACNLVTDKNVARRLAQQMRRETVLSCAKTSDTDGFSTPTDDTPDPTQVEPPSDVVRSGASGKEKRRWWESNPRWRICNQAASPVSPEENDHSSERAAPGAAIDAEDDALDRCKDVAPSSNQAELLTVDPELAAVAEAWVTLPEAIKAGILAIVHAAKGSPDPATNCMASGAN